MLFSIAIAGTSAFIFSIIFTKIMINFAFRYGITAKPKKDRWHKKETPLLGGVAIFLAFTCGIFCVYLFQAYDLKPSSVLLLCSTGIFLLGLYDDLKNIAPQHKLAVQIVFACIFLLLGNKFQWFNRSSIDAFITLFWIVGITNAINLLDNMDGLAAGISAISCVSMLFLLCNYSSAPYELIGNLFILASLLGSLVGFLIFNFNPAKIFMGDAGSLFIGFILSTSSITSQDIYIPKQGIPHIFAVVLTPILLLLIPILDTTLVSIMRRLTGKKISQGGKDHSSHRLVALGFSERESVLILYVFAVASGLMAFIIQYVRASVAILILALYFLLITLAWLYLARVRVYKEYSLDAIPKGFASYAFEIGYKRRLFEVILDVFLIAVSYYSSYVLRFEGNIGGNINFFLKSLPILIALQIISNFALGVYKGIWEKAGLRDLFSYAKSISLASMLCILLLVFLYRFESFSRAVFIIYWGIMLVVFSLSRLFFRVLDEKISKSKQKGTPTIIYGAGKGGLMALQELEGNGLYGLKIIGFVDDNHALWGKRLEGYPIFGGRDAIPELLETYGVKEIIVSFRNPTDEWLRELRNAFKSEDAEVRVRRLVIRIQ